MWCVRIVSSFPQEVRVQLVNDDCNDDGMGGRMRAYEGVPAAA